MWVASPTAGTWSSSRWRPDNEFETDNDHSSVTACLGTQAQRSLTSWEKSSLDSSRRAEKFTSSPTICRPKNTTCPDVSAVPRCWSRARLRHTPWRLMLPPARLTLERDLPVDAADGRSLQHHSGRVTLPHGWP